MASHAEIVSSLYKALMSGDEAAAHSLVHPEITLFVPGDHPTAGEHCGVDNVLRFFAARARRRDDAAAISERVDLMVGHDHVAVYNRVRATRDDLELDNHTIHLHRIADGRIANIWIYNRDQKVIDRFWPASEHDAR